MEVRLAVLEANYNNLQRQAIDHEERDNDRFDKTLSFVESMKEEILDGIGNLDDKFTEKFADLHEKVNPLWDEKNERKGAITASKFIGSGISGIIGGAIVLAIEYFKK